ncbi:hypothetical protein RintRC_5525 [Richelia intracellularis]|nr:hypothetical protein RintRC_5525 [Richelia intracellularis]
MAFALENQDMPHNCVQQSVIFTTKLDALTLVYTVLLSEITAKYRQRIENCKQKGELNSGVSKEFIHDLLKTQRCICVT